MISLDQGFCKPVCLMLVLLISIASTGSSIAGEITVSKATVTDADRVHLALVTVADAVSNPAAINLHCFGTLLPDAGRAEGVNRIQEVAAQLAVLKDSVSPLALGPIAFRKIAVSGIRPNLQATTELTGIVDGHPVVIPVKVDLQLTTISIQIVNITDLLNDLDTLVDECYSFATRLRSSGWIPRGNLAPPQRSTYSPNLIRPKNVSGSHARFNSTASRAEFDGADIFSRPYGVFCMYWDDWVDEFDREFMLVSDANWDRMIISANARLGDEYDDWFSDFGSHGSGPGNFSHPAGIGFTPQLYIIADTYNKRAVVYEVTDWSNGSFEFQYEIPVPGNVADVAAKYIPGTVESHRNFAVLDSDNCRVHTYNYDALHIISFFSQGSGDNQVDNPTSICYGRDKHTGFSWDILYVVDDGNKRIVSKNLRVPYAFSSSEGNVTFPEDAYLTSIDVDYYGYVYVLDSYHGMIYKLDADLRGLIATFGALGENDGALWYPQQLSLATGWYGPEDLEDPLERRDIGDILITERWGTSTGIRRFVKGTDVISHWLEYIPMVEEGSPDFVKCHWFQTGASRNQGCLYAFGGYEIACFPLTVIQLPGPHYFTYELPESWPDHCWFRFEVEVASIYGGSNDTTFVDSIWVDRYVDSTCIATFPDTTDPGKPELNPYVIESSRSYPYQDWCVHYLASDRWYWVEAHVDGDHDCHDSMFYAHWSAGGRLDRFYPDTLGSTGQSELLTNGLIAYFKLDGDPPWDLIPGHLENLGTIMIAASYDTSEGISFTDTSGLEWKLYPNYCATPCTTCVPEDPPGCPMLYSWDGGEFVLENNLMPQSEESGRPTQDFTDAYLLDFAQVDQGQEYRFRISEDEQEQSKFRRLKLAALDVPLGTDKLILDNRLRLGALTGTGITPTSAVTQDGQNVLAALTEADSVLFSSTEPGYIDLTYPVETRRIESKSLSRGSGGGPSPPPPGKNPRKVTSDQEDRIGPNVYIILARNRNGEYEVVGKRHPRRRSMRRPIDLSDYTNNGVVHARIAWTRRIELDHLPYLTYNRLDVTPQLLQLTEATHSDSGDVLTQLSEAGSGFVSLQPGQQLDLAYQAPPLADSLQRLLLFRAVGRYESYVPPLIKPSEALPESFSFSQNYPNPFNPSTTFGFSLPNPAQVTLSVYNVLGQKVATVIDQTYTAGHHVYDWDGKDSRGQSLSSGVYFARLVAGEHSSTKKMVVVK